jgi:hypothetical protein
MPQPTNQLAPDKNNINRLSPSAIKKRPKDAQQRLDCDARKTQHESREYGKVLPRIQQTTPPHIKKPFCRNATAGTPAAMKSGYIVYI